MGHAGPLFWCVGFDRRGPALRSFARQAILYERETVASASIAKVLYVLYAVGDHEDSETAVARAVEGGWTGHLRIKRLTGIEEPDYNSIFKRFRFDADRFVSAAFVGMPHNIACRFIDGKLKLTQARIV